MQFMFTVGRHHTAFTLRAEAFGAARTIRVFHATFAWLGECAVMGFLVGCATVMGVW